MATAISPATPMVERHLVTWWRCKVDGDRYIVGPWDRPLKMVDLILWHQHGAHGGYPVDADYDNWSVFVCHAPRPATIPRPALRVVR